MTTKNLTIADIAERAGVSPTTVSRVLSGAARVSDEKRVAVLQAAEEANYRPSAMARGLAKGVFPAVHVLIGDIRNTIYSEQVMGVDQVARENGYTLVLGHTEDRLDRELECLEVTREHGFAGVILLSPMGEAELSRALSDLTALGRTVVIVNRLVKGFQADSVITNNERAAYDITRFLIGLGHTRIAHLGGLRSSSASLDRGRGYVRAMREAGLPAEESGIEYGTLRMDCGEAYAERLIEDGLQPTAVFAANDLMALGILSTLAARGVRVPEDISVVGFDDNSMSRFPLLRLTTVRVADREMGAAAMRLMLERSRGESTTFRTVVFETELMERGTHGPPRA